MTGKAENAIRDSFEVRGWDAAGGYSKVSVTAEFYVIGKSMKASIESIDKGTIERRLASAVCESITLTDTIKDDEQ